MHSRSSTFLWSTNHNVLVARVRRNGVSPSPAVATLEHMPDLWKRCYRVSPGLLATITLQLTDMIRTSKEARRRRVSRWDQWRAQGIGEEYFIRRYGDDAIAGASRQIGAEVEVLGGASGQPWAKVQKANE